MDHDDLVANPGPMHQTNTLLSMYMYIDPAYPVPTTSCPACSAEHNPAAIQYFAMKPQTKARSLAGPEGIYPGDTVK